ncbi:MAG: erythromycin esterase family protein [Gemmatimonadaceae bacterium]|nr:erythromycin esterase family protein [Gemmatimonadaceae bacterium]
MPIDLLRAVAMRSASTLLAGLLFTGSADLAEAQRPLNLDFEMATLADSTLPWGWSRGWSAFLPGPTAQFTLDTRAPRQGARALRITASDTIADPPARQLMLQVPAGFVHGQRLVLRGVLRTAQLRGRAVLSLEAWGDRVVLAADSVQRSGTLSEWQTFSLAITVPKDPSIHSFVVIAAVVGDGSAWFDDLQLSRDGVPLTQLPSVPAPSDAQLRWLAARSAALGPAMSQAPGADLALFDRIVGDARVIALGESTHGTGDFFAEKHRLIRHLIETQGVRVFALEANQRAVAALDRYTREGVGTATQALGSVFAVWNTEEMREFVEWLRRYNQAHPRDPVHVIGYDMQDHREPSDSLLAFLRHTAPALHTTAERLTASYRQAPSYVVPQAPDSMRFRWRAEADTLLQLVQAQRTAWLASATTRRDSLCVHWAEHDAALYHQAARANASLNSPDRDSLMAANLVWTMDVLHPGARVALWAHDLHVSRGGDRQRSPNGGAQMGAVLAKAYGVDYRAFSLLTRTGTYRGTRSMSDYRMMTAPAFPAPEGSVEWVLARVAALLTASRGTPSASRGLITDLRVSERDPDGAWLWTPRPVRAIGYAVYDYGFEMAVTMPLEFDGVILIDRSSAAEEVRATPPRR